MRRIKRVFLRVHFVLWTLLLLLVGLQLSGENNPHWLSLTSGVMLSALYVFYGHFLLLTRYLGKNQKLAYFSRLGALILTGPLPYLILHHRKMDTFDVFFEYYIISLLSFVLIFVFLGWLARITENLVINTFKKEELEKQAVEAELYYLKSQINPHFLFNTLNNIHTLVYKKAPAAPEAVLQLASLMRYMIYESNVPFVPLTREMDYLQDYISLQQLKYKQSPVVDLKISGHTDSSFVAPLLFIHLLENAYKHSPARLQASDIKVNMQICDDILTFSIQNPIVHKQGGNFEGPGGIGLPNVRKRLQLLYPLKHSLETSQQDDIFNVTLKLKGLKLPDDEKKVDMLYH